MKPAHGVITVEEHEQILAHKRDLGFALWIIGTLGFTAVDAWCAKGRTTFSMATRKALFLRHPLGRAILAGAMSYLYMHLVDETKLHPKATRR